jgi:DNA-binding transcriptional LysR family regulator
MDTEALRAFIVVAEQQSFSQAAEQLHITQPAISKRVAGLEQQLNSRLFDRIGRTTVLTDSGKVLLPRARKILQEIEDGRREISELSGEVSGRLSLAISHHIGLHRLPPALKAFAQRYPEVQYDIQFTESEAAHDQVAHGDIELALVTLAPTPPPKLICKTVWKDPLFFVASKEHPLSHQETVSLKQLSQSASILPDESTYTGELINKLFEVRHLRLEAARSTNYLESIKMMVAIGLGWSVLPKTMIDKQLKVLDVPYINLSRELGYIHHPARTLSNAGKAFIQLLRKQ